MWKISMSKWDFQIYPTCKLKRTVRCIILMWRWAGLVYEGPRKQRCGSAIKRCGSVSLFSLWCGSGSDFTLWCGSGSTFNFDVNPDPDPSVHFDADADPDPAPYQKVKRICNHWRASDRLRLHVEPSGLNFERPRPSMASIWASTSSWFGSGSNLSLFTVIRIRIQHPKIMRILADLDPQHCWKIRIPVIFISIVSPYLFVYIPKLWLRLARRNLSLVSVPVRIYSEAVVKAGPA